MNILDSEVLTADGVATIPYDCYFIVAVCKGSTAAPYLNGNQMQTYASVSAQGVLEAISVHVSHYPTIQYGELPFNLNGANHVTLIYFDDAVCARQNTVSDYDDDGSAGGTLVVNPATEIVVGVALGQTATITLKGDGSDLTLLHDTTTYKVGYITPADNSLTCLATSPEVATGYWFTPAPIYHPSTLIAEAYWEWVPVWHPSYLGASPPYEPDTWLPGYWTYTGVYHPAVYSTSYWEYPANVWIEPDTSEIACIYVSISDTMVGGTYVTRPRFG